MKLSTILDQIDMGSIALPEFQRGYVWSRDQVRKLMRSLYRGYPVGSLLMWETRTEGAEARGDYALATGTVKLLLDGQQRITSLYGVVNGRPPAFFDGDSQRFLGLYFNLKTEEFEFYGPVKMRDDPHWISVTELLKIGAGNAAERLYTTAELRADAALYLARINALDSIKGRDFFVDVITGEDKTVDLVVEIFNEVNSGGTKLSKGDLALAKICASWPQARDEMKLRLQKWHQAGFDFKLDWFLRCINTTLTGESLFTSLKDVTVAEFSDGLIRAEHHIDYLLNLIASRLGLDHDRVLGSRYAFPLLVRYLDTRGGRLADYHERDRLLYFYLHAMFWGRYSGSTESVLQTDLNAIKNEDGALDRLLGQLRQNRGDLRLNARDFEGASRSNRFYPLLYLLTRVWQARDFESGIDLSAHLLGKLNTLQVHHIFPQNLLYKHGYGKNEVNAVANFSFLTQATNLLVTNRDPAEYFPHFEAMHPGVLASHWIPLDPVLWRVENYLEFLDARRELLAQAANDFLDSLVTGAVPETEPTISVLQREVRNVPGQIESTEEEELLWKCMVWMEQQGLPIGELQYELVEEGTNLPLAVLDLAWPDGVQVGLSKPVALLVDETEDTLRVAQAMDYRCFRDFEEFRGYIQQDILGLERTAS